MKQLFVWKVSSFFILLLFCMTLYSAPPVVHADEFVTYCLENPEECQEDGVPSDRQDDVEKEEDRAIQLGAWEYIKTALALVFVVGLLFGLLKFVNRKNRLYDKTRLMKNMGGISLGQQKSVQLIVVGETYYLIGVGDDINLLKEITDQDEIARLVEYYEEVDIGSTSGWLAKLIDMMSGSKQKDSTESKKNSADFSNIFNTRLDEIKEERKRHMRRLTEKERNQDE